MQKPSPLLDDTTIWCSLKLFLVFNNISTFLVLAFGIKQAEDWTILSLECYHFYLIVIETFTLGWALVRER